MHTNGWGLLEMSMEIGMVDFWMGVLGTALTKETYFSKSFNNYEDHLLPNFDPLSSIRTYNNCGQFTWFLPFVTWPSVDFLLTYSPSLLVHVVIEWPFTSLVKKEKKLLFRWATKKLPSSLKTPRYFISSLEENKTTFENLKTKMFCKLL